MTAGYAHRDAILLRLGFATYADYLTSGLWASIRARVFEEHGRLVVIREDIPRPPF